VEDRVTGDVIRAGTVAHIPDGHDIFRPVQIRAAEFVDHMAKKTTELGLHVVGDTPEHVAAVALEGAHRLHVVGDTPEHVAAVALEGAHLIEVTERPSKPLL
jgi:hypothetical protein